MFHACFFFLDFILIIDYYYYYFDFPLLEGKYSSDYYFFLIVFKVTGNLFL